MFGGTLEHSPPQLDSKARVPYLFSSRSLINTWPSSGEFCSFREWSSDLLIKKKKKIGEVSGVKSSRVSIPSRLHTLTNIILAK